VEERVKATKHSSLISIIVPVYNCEHYIARCIESILMQTYNCFELIIINDGSTDNSAQICKRYAKNDSRVIYIEQLNQGVCHARKQGIKLAAGKYIGFVDADDYIEPEMYEQLLPYMEKADLVTSGYYQLGRKVFDKLHEGLYQTSEEIKFFYENAVLFQGTNEQGISSNLWSKLFDAQKLKAAAQTVPNDIFYGEDMAILLNYIFQCQTFYISTVCAYHYENNSASISNSINKKYLQNLNSLYLCVENAINKTAYKDELLARWNHAMWIALQRTPRFMEFDLTDSWKRITYLNPYANLLKAKRIILYGAGTVGRDYYRLCKKLNDYNLVMWVDEMWQKYRSEGWNVQSVDNMLQMECDYVLIAVKSALKAQQIEKDLTEKGIAGSKLLWKEPISLVE